MYTTMKISNEDIAFYTVKAIVIGTNVAFHCATFALTFYLAYGPYFLIESAAIAGFIAAMGRLFRFRTLLEDNDSPRNILTAMAVCSGVSIGVLFAVATSSYSALGSALIAVCVFLLSICHCTMDPAIETAYAQEKRDREKREEFINGLSESTKNAFKGAQARRERHARHTEIIRHLCDNGDEISQDPDRDASKENDYEPNCAALTCPGMMEAFATQIAAEQATEQDADEDAELETGSGFNEAAEPDTEPVSSDEDA